MTTIRHEFTYQQLQQEIASQRSGRSGPWMHVDDDPSPLEMAAWDVNATDSAMLLDIGRANRKERAAGRIDQPESVPAPTIRQPMTRNGLHVVWDPGSKVVYSYHAVNGTLKDNPQMLTTEATMAEVFRYNPYITVRTTVDCFKAPDGMHYIRSYASVPNQDSMSQPVQGPFVPMNRTEIIVDQANHKVLMQFDDYSSSAA